MPPDKLGWIKGRDLDLFVETFSNATRTVQVRGFTETEQIIGNHTTNADRTLATSVIQITGVPINLTARTVETSVSRGECYVKVSLRVEGVVVALLIAGYVSDTGAIMYPEGKFESSIEGPGLIRTIIGTDPAVGAEISETVPTGARWRLISFKVILDTDATAQTRIPHLSIDDGTTESFASAQGQLVTNVSTAHLCFAVLGQEDLSALLFGTQCIPNNMNLMAGYRIRTNTTLLAAGDDYHAPQYLVEEWIEP